MARSRYEIRLEVDVPLDGRLRLEGLVEGTRDLARKLMREAAPQEPEGGSVVAVEVCEVFGRVARG